MISPRRNRRLAAVALAAALSATGLASAHAAAPRAHYALGGDLVFYSAQGYDITMGKAFSKATGVKVLTTDDSTGPIVAKIEAEQNNPHWDFVPGDHRTHPPGPYVSIRRLAVASFRRGRPAICGCLASASGRDRGDVVYAQYRQWFYGK